MKTFFDSSAFAKRYVEERGSHLVEEICFDSSDLALSIICVPEILSALNRRLRENEIEQSDYVCAKNKLFEEIEDITILNITPWVIHKSIDLLESNTLRTLDALHIACALEWQPDLFVSSDHRQSDAAQKSGLAIKLV